jgi:restriction system protein
MGNMYMIRAGTEGKFFEEFQEKNFVAIDWSELGDLNQYKNLDEIKNSLAKKYPEYKKQAIAMIAGQIKRFLDIKNDDFVITYNKEERYYLIGKIKSDYIYNDEFSEHPNLRNVAWEGKILRDLLSTNTKNSLGAISTLFEISGDSKDELLLMKDKEQDQEKESIIDDGALKSIKDDFEERAHEFIKDKVLNLSWEEMQDLIAALIRALGYKTTVSQYGPDRGKDIIASPDGLNLEEPRIIVEVKHRKGQMGSQEIRSFLGAFRKNKGIYVSTGGFSKDAKYEAERALHSITLIDADYLVDLIIQNYDNFDIEGRTLIPLKKLYWPL